MYQLIKQLPLPDDLTKDIIQYVGRPYTTELLQTPLNKYSYCVYGYLNQYFSILDLPNGDFIEDSIWHIDMIQMNIYQDDIEDTSQLLISVS